MAARRKSITPKYFDQGEDSGKVPRIAYTANVLRFQSEEDLEIYIENHFDELFPDLELLQRQFRLHTQRYDLLCRHKHTRQAVLLELKNEEDRSIVWQLVRYRKLITDKQPFHDRIDYSRPIELIAIAPSFHEDSLIDKEACKFEADIKLLTFSFMVKEKILDLAGSKHIIPYSISGLPDEAIPKASFNSTNIYNDAPALWGFTLKIKHQEYKDDFWHLRNLFLAQPKVKEIINPLCNQVFYATSNREGSKTLAEIYIFQERISLFLYLPSSLPDSPRKSITFGRFAIVYTEDSNMFNLDSSVQYLITCSTAGISQKKIENILTHPTLNRSSTIKFCSAKNYTSILTGIGLLAGIRDITNFKKLYPDFVSSSPTNWREEFEAQSTDKLGWFVDLAIRSWNYKI